MQKNEVGLLILTKNKNYLQWSKDQNVKAKSIKLLEENISINLCDLVFGEDFLDMISQA